MSEIRIVKTWDEIPPVVQDGVEFFSLRVLEKNYHDMKAQLAAAEQRAAQAERDAVRECERIAYGSIETANTFYPIREAIRNRYPQHFKGE